MRWFATPKWEAERVCVGDLVFWLTLGPDAGLTPRDDCFELMKSRTLMEEYERFFASIADRPQRVLELGIRDGGSVALWNELLRPLQHAAVDISTRGDSPYFREWVTRRGLGQRVRTYWGVDQGDQAALRAAVDKSFDGPLDLVLDDASHFADPTRASLETVFPLLRPGAFYVIEDWGWDYWPTFQVADHPWRQINSASRVAIELLEATADVAERVVQYVGVYHGFVVAQRSMKPLPPPGVFRLSDYIRRRAM